MGSTAVGSVASEKLTFIVFSYQVAESFSGIFGILTFVPNLIRREVLQHRSVCNVLQFISGTAVNHCFHSAIRSLSSVKPQSWTCSPRTLDSVLQKSFNWPHSKLDS